MGQRLSLTGCHMPYIMRMMPYLLCVVFDFLLLHSVIHFVYFVFPFILDVLEGSCGILCRRLSSDLAHSPQTAEISQQTHDVGLTTARRRHDVAGTSWRRRVFAGLYQCKISTDDLKTC